MNDHASNHSTVLLVDLALGFLSTDYGLGTIYENDEGRAGMDDIGQSFDGDTATSSNEWMNDGLAERDLWSFYFSIFFFFLILKLSWISSWNHLHPMHPSGPVL